MTTNWQIKKLYVRRNGEIVVLDKVYAEDPRGYPLVFSDGIENRIDGNFLTPEIPHQYDIVCEYKGSFNGHVYIKERDNSNSPDYMEVQFEPVNVPEHKSWFTKLLNFIRGLL